MPSSPTPDAAPPADAPRPTPRRDRRLLESDAFPNGWPGYTARSIALATGERVRVVHAPAEPGAARPGTPAVVCLHGWGASAYGYRHVLGPLAAAGADAYAPDLRGHGWSAKPLAAAAYTPRALATWTLDLLDALALTRVVLVGHSLGGAIALRTAVQGGDRIAALVLLAPLGLYPMDRLEQLRRITPEHLDRWVPRIADFRPVTAVALRSAYGRLGRATARDIDEYWAPTADPAFAQAARLIFHADPWSPLSPAELGAVECPVEVVVGSRDNLIRPDDLARTSALPHASLDVVRDAGHVLADEVPARVLAAIARARALAAAKRPDAS